MAVKHNPSVATGTMTRCSAHAKKEILALAKRIGKDNAKYMKRAGIMKASSTLAVDALLYWGALSGHLNGKGINSKNNTYCKLMSVMEEENNE